MAYPVTISPYWNPGPGYYQAYPNYPSAPRAVYSPYMQAPQYSLPTIVRPVYVPVPVSPVPVLMPPPAALPGPKIATVEPLASRPGATDTLVPSGPKPSLSPGVESVNAGVSAEDKRLLEAIHKLRENNPKLRAILTPDNISHLEQGFKNPESSLKMALDLTIGDSLRDELHHKRWWRRKAARSAVKQFETALTFMPIPGPIKRRVKTYLDELRAEKVSPAASANANLKAALNQAMDAQA